MSTCSKSFQEDYSGQGEKVRAKSELKSFSDPLCVYMSKAEMLQKELNRERNLRLNLEVENRILRQELEKLNGGTEKLEEGYESDLRGGHFEL